MLSLHGKHGVVISRIPVMQNGLGDVVTRHFPDFEIDLLPLTAGVDPASVTPRRCDYCRCFRRIQNPRGALEEYYRLLNQYRDIHWIFLVSQPFYPIAVELLMRRKPRCFLIWNLSKVS